MCVAHSLALAVRPLLSAHWTERAYTLTLVQTPNCEYCIPFFAFLHFFCGFFYLLSARIESVVWCDLAISFGCACNMIFLVCGFHLNNLSIQIDWASEQATKKKQHVKRERKVQRNQEHKLSLNWTERVLFSVHVVVIPLLYLMLVSLLLWCPTEKKKQKKNKSAVHSVWLNGSIYNDYFCLIHAQVFTIQNI